MEMEAPSDGLLLGAIGFGFASHELKIWREKIEPITKRSNGNRNEFRQ